MAQSYYCDVKYTDFIWEMKYPFLLTDCDLCSPNFSIDSCGITQYYLNFCSKTVDGVCYVSLRIKKHEWNCDPGTTALDFKVSITGNTINEDEYTLEHVTFAEQSETIFEKEFSVANIKDQSMESEVTFKLEIQPNINSADVEDFWTCNYEDLESLSSDIANSMHNKRFANLTFRSIDDKPIKSNKTIFAQRYPTLAESLNLFRNTQQEFNLGIAKEGISNLLNYLYSGKINMGHSHYGLLELISRAELYHLQHILYLEPRIVHAATSIPLKYGSFELVIPKFSELENNTYIDNYLCCDPLALWTQLKIQFYVEENADCERYLMFRLRRIEENGKLLVYCKISIIGKKECEYNQSYKLNFECQGEQIIPSFIKVEKLKENTDYFLKNDSLKLRFEIVLSNLEVDSRYDSVRCLHVERGKFPSIAGNLWALRKDIANLHRNPKNSDVSVQTESSSTPAHKIILCARSPHFSRILEDENTEGNSIFINMYDETIVRDILSYIYCGDIKTESKTFKWAVNLYRATKKFEIETLKQKCRRYISDNVNAENVSVLLEKL